MDPSHVLLAAIAIDRRTFLHIFNSVYCGCFPDIYFSRQPPPMDNAVTSLLHEEYVVSCLLPGITLIVTIPIDRQRCQSIGVNNIHR